MTYQEDSTLPDELLEQRTKQGFDILPELIWIMINSAMQIEARNEKQRLDQSLHNK